MASEVLRIRIRADAGNTAAVFNDISRNILGMTIGAAGARQGLLGLGAALSGAQITGRLTSAVFGALAFGAINLTDGLLSAAGAQAQFRNNLQALLKDASQVTKVTAVVKEFADATAFSNEEVFKVAQNLIAAKVPLDNLIPTLQMLGDVSLGNAEKFSGIATAWYQIIAKGKLTAEEINQIAERGVSVWSILAEETGQTVPELQKLAEAGRLTVDAYMPILQRGLAKNYAGSLKEASSLSTNLLVNIGKSVTNFRAAVGQGLDSTINPALQSLAMMFRTAALYAVALTRSEIWTKFTAALQAVADTLLPIIKALGKNVFIAMIRSIQLLTPVLYLAAGAMRGIAYAATQAMQFLKPLTDSFRRIAQQIKSLDWTGLYTSIKNQSGDIGTRIKTILTETVVIAWTEFKDNIKDKLPELGAGAIVGAFGFLTDNEELSLAIQTWLTANTVTLGPKLKGAINWGTILATLFGAADIQKGLEEQDFTEVTGGIATILAGIFGNAKYGPVGAAIGAALVQALFKYGFPRWQAMLAAGDFTAFGEILVIVLPAAVALAQKRIGLAIGVALAGAALIEGIKEGFATGDFSELGIALGHYILLALSFTSVRGFITTTFMALGTFLLAQVKAGFFFLLAAMPGIGVMLKAALLAVLNSAWLAITLGFAALTLIVMNVQDWFNTGNILSAIMAALGVLILGIGVLIGGIPAFIIASLVTVLALLFGRDLVEQFVNFLKTFNESLMAKLTVIGMVVATALAGIMANITGLINFGPMFLALGAKLLALGPVLLTALGAVFTGVVTFLAGLPAIVLVALAAVVVAIIAGLLYAFGVEWDDITKWFSDAWTGLVKYVKELLGISSPSTVFSDLGVNIIEGLYNGLVKALDTGWSVVVEGFKSFAKNIVDWFLGWSGSFGETLFKVFSQPDGMTKAIANLWDEAKTGVTETLDKLLKWFKDWGNFFVEMLVLVFTQPDAVVNAIVDLWNKAKQGVQSVLDTIIDYFKRWATSDFAKKLQDFFGADVISNAIKAGLTAAWDGAKDVLNGFITKAKEAFSNVFGGVSASTSASNPSEDRDKKWRQYNFIKNTDGEQAADAYRRAEGFAMGGSFRVGGSGGIDSQLVQFRASPNETVTIRRPDQGGGGFVINTLNVYADSYQGGQDAARAIRDALGAQRRMMFATT